MANLSIDRIVLRVLSVATGWTSRVPRVPGMYRTRVLTGPLAGTMLTLPALERPSFALGNFERHVVNAIRAEMVSGGVAYDVGAYVGYLTMVMSRCAGPDGTVVAFEASPRVLPALKANLAADEFANTEIVDRAVSDQSGTLSFEMYPYSTIGRISRDGTADDAVTVEVQAITLDEYVYELGNPPPDLIKIDVNGAELQVLQGADRLLREQAPKVLVEVRTRTQPEVADLMAAAGYRARHLEAEDQARADLYNVVFVPNATAR